MTLTSKPLAVILFVMIFGGITLSSSLGWWVTESTKVPVTFADGEFAGQANPADIRGSYTFGDIANSFDVTADVLAEAFGVQDGEPSAFAVKNLEAIYTDSEYEIGTTSLRLFVAFYTGLPFDTSGQEIYLPKSASDILLAKGTLTPERIAYLEKYRVNLNAGDAVIEVAPESSTTDTQTSASEEYTVKGKTTFGELLAWGVPQTAIENMIGAPIPDSAVTLKDYASQNGLDFETLKPAIQAEVDKVKP